MNTTTRYLSLFIHVCNPFARSFSQFPVSAFSVRCCCSSFVNDGVIDAANCGPLYLYTLPKSASDFSAKCALCDVHHLIIACSNTVRGRSSFQTTCLLVQKMEAKCAVHEAKMPVHLVRAYLPSRIWVLHIQHPSIYQRTQHRSPIHSSHPHTPRSFVPSTKMGFREQPRRSDPSNSAKRKNKKTSMTKKERMERK